MAEMTLEQRVERLEKLFAQAIERRHGDRDWRNTVGMFRDDPIWKEVVDAGRQIREEDRRLSRP